MTSTDRSFGAIDEAQMALANEIFDSRESPKKAAGRAIGTLQEILAYSVLHHYELDSRTYLEYPLPEQGLEEVTHEVEFSIHPKVGERGAEISGRKHENATLSDLDASSLYDSKANRLKKPTLVHHDDDGWDRIRTNPGLLKQDDLKNWEYDSIPIAYYNNGNKKIVLLDPQPIGFIECKRVGLEEGTTSGPQTIEKAKQATLVAFRTSRLQKIITSDGKKGLLIDDDHVEVGNFEELWEDTLSEGDPEELRGVVRSVLFFSNHGNWYPQDNEGKGVKMIKSSFDWAVWVEDEGLIELIEFVLNDTDMRNAFNLHVESSETILTKSKFESDARESMLEFVSSNWDRISEDWFTVLEPEGKSIEDLMDEFRTVTQVFES